MGDNGQNQWIVLINKAPKGPLSESEIRALLNQGILKTNDLAFQFHPQTSSGTSDWKFLWQFEEFDRRRMKEGDSDEKENTERRDTPSEKVLKEKAQALLPEEISNIRPEDLIVKARISSQFDYSSDSSETANSEPFRNGHKTKIWPALTIALVGFIFVGYQLSQPNKEETSSVRGPNSSGQLETNERPRLIEEVRSKPELKRGGGRNLSGTIDRRVKPEGPLQPPKIESQKDSGAIAEEEWIKKREERWEKERKEEEERRKAELRRDERGSEGDEEEEDSPKAKKKKKKRKAVTQEADERDVDSSGELRTDEAEVEPELEPELKGEGGD